MEEKQRHAEELKRQIEMNEKQQIATPVDDGEKEMMQQHIQELNKQKEDFQN